MTNSQNDRNKGSTLITMLVAVTFLGILLSVILAVSTAGLRMKQVEYRMKKNFYTNEEILADIYNGIGKEASACFGKAYATVLSETVENDGKSAYQNEEEAYRAFTEDFLKRLAMTFPVGAQDQDTLDLLNQYTLHSAGEAKAEDYKEIVEINNQLIIKGLTVSYKEQDGTNPTGYESKITTDIVIDIPYVTFFEESSRLLDYALIANKGIYFDGSDGSGDRTVEGNLYAGTDSSGETAENKERYRNQDVAGGLNFYKAVTAIRAAYVIVKGDISLRQSALSVQMYQESEAKPQVWAESMRTVEGDDRNLPPEESSITMDGQLFLANDLELNARKSRVDLDGDFYAYNNNRYETQEKKSLETGSAIHETTEHTMSSSVIINGDQSYLDLSGLHTFVVAGMAYIDLQSRDFPTGSPAGIQEYATGESLALKTNQYLYLAPAACLTGLNPGREGDAAVTWVDGMSWFAYNKGLIDSVQPLEQKTVSRNGVSYTYYYLNFISQSKKKEYAQLVLNMVEPSRMSTDMPADIRADYDQFDELEKQQIWEMKQEIEAKALAEHIRSSIEVADDTKARIYTNGAVSKVKDVKLSAEVPADEAILGADDLGNIQRNMYKRYQFLYTDLDPKEEFPLIPEDTLEMDPARLSDQMPADKFVDMNQLTAIGAEIEYKSIGRYGSACKTMISAGDYTVNRSFSGLIICKGDVKIKAGVSVEGLVIAGGRIYVEGGGSIMAGRGVVQAIIEEEYAQESVKEAGEAKNRELAIYYLRDYEAAQLGKAQTERITGTDYADYVSYKNWRKGDEN